MDPYIEQNGGKIASPLEVTDTLTVYNMMKNASFLLKEIGRDADARKALEMASVLRADFRRELIDNGTTVAGNCQTSQAFALASDIFEKDERPLAEAKLLELIREKNNTNACGMIGLRHIFHVLSEMGESALAHKIITSKHRTCYGYWVANGGTTAWERFQEAGDPLQSSLNHHFLGDISNWFIRELAGLYYNPNLDDISYLKIIPHPVLEDAAPFAKVQFDSRFGRIEVRWEKKVNRLSLAFSLPAGMHATVKAVDGWTFENGTTETYCAKSDSAQTLSLTLIKA